MRAGLRAGGRVGMQLLVRIQPLFPGRAVSSALCLLSEEHIGEAGVSPERSQAAMDTGRSAGLAVPAQLRIALLISLLTILVACRIFYLQQLSDSNSGTT